MREALPRQDDALADRCAFAVMLARTRVGFGGSPERIFVFARPPVQRRWYHVQSIRHCEHRGHDYYRRHWRGRNLYVAPDCTGTVSVPNGPSFNIYVGPGAPNVWFTQTAGGAGSGAGLGVGAAIRLPGR